MPWAGMRRAVGARPRPFIGGLGSQEGGVVGVAFEAGGVEGCGVGTVERGVLCEAVGQIGVRDEEFSEGDGVGFAFVEELLAGVLVDGFVGDEDSTEDFFEAWADAVGAGVLAGGAEGEVAFAQTSGDAGAVGGGVVVEAAMDLSRR